VTLNPPTQYADDRNLSARQRLWSYQRPYFDITAWVLDLALPKAGDAVLDVGCGNGMYLRALAARGVEAVGCDVSYGILAPNRPHRWLCNGDAERIPIVADAFDVVLAPHMLYHVPDRERAARELRRVLRSDGVCVVVTNGAQHMRSLRDLVEAAARVTNPEWEMRNPATHAFSLDNGAAQLAVAFETVDCVRTDAAAVSLDDAGVLADYVASVADHYEHEINRPWADVVSDVRAAVQEVIDRDGRFVVKGETGAFVCR
jgi:SAM-dependent methyltransferase